MNPNEEQQWWYENLPDGPEKKAGPAPVGQSESETSGCSQAPVAQFPSLRSGDACCRPENPASETVSANHSTLQK